MWRMCDGRRAALAWLVFAAVGAGEASAVQVETGAAGFPTGRVIDNVAAHDTSRSFALYIPTDYSPGRRWPLVLILDPRGRGEAALRPFVESAERLGYVLASSDNTASDVEGDPNTPAVNAMLATLQPQLSLDDRRFYLFGMSGTARAAWALGYAAIPHIAGVAGFGAGPPPDMDLEAAHARYGAPFVFYGGAGETDYNHSELVLLEEQLRRLGFHYHTATYPGPHGWPRDDSQFDDALSWMHWMAMREGLLVPDSAWLAAEYARRLDAAEKLEAAGEPGPAWRAYSSLASDAEHLIQRGAAADRAADLGDDPAVIAWRSRRLEFARAHVAYKERVAAWLQRTQVGRVPDLEAALAALRVDSLRALAADPGAVEQAAAAERAQADVFSLTSFYYPRFYIARGEWRRARLVLEIAAAIRPGSPTVRRQLDRVSRELIRD